ncbi:class I SAM-dependent methyltransferase [Alteromonas pelagimontana]|uniref:Class I SAM-dependent methyltransferase n=1 Tax=Alteromonas pelagimontana TaxID=1858656 RepID=A0A6M4MGE6_9ALTE|nr:class I SAM-dependent methyltransferase [Alteromonas pelagimontana]QJR81938.1 class I SAM-dependent methyltransferase [Alteromonas pelagimontana]
MGIQKIVPSTTEETRLIENYIRRRVKNIEPLQILEAGCGQKWPLQLSEVRFTLAGIDIDKDAIALRKSKYDDLDEVIIGDLRTAKLEPNKFDVIYTAYVLEHIENVQAVLDNFSRWLKPEGIMIIKIPDRDSVYGFIARSTPHWFHVFYYRYVKGNKNAGKPGHMPYPVVYDGDLSREKIRQFCENNGLTILEELGKNNYSRRLTIVDRSIKAFAKSLSTLSLGRLAWQHNDLIYIIEKNAQDSSEKSKAIPLT